MPIRPSTSLTPPAPSRSKSLISEAVNFCATELVLLGLVLLGASSALGGTSQLWGENGELWDPRGRLPDYSWAGYHGGEKAIPDVEQLGWPTIDVTDFGAVPNDSIDDLAAFQAAIAAAPADGAILHLPKGEYVLKSWLKVDRGNLIIRGDGDQDLANGGTVLFCPLSSDEVSGSHIQGYHTGEDGLFITFTGLRFNDGQPINEETRRGDRTVTVVDGSVFKVGQPVVLSMTDTEIQGTLWDHLHNGQAIPIEDPASWSLIQNTRWSYTVERVERNLVTLREPLQMDIRKEWGPLLAASRHIQEIGIQDLRMRFPLPATHPAHLTEPGYNGIMFDHVRDSWIRNVTFENADNGITFHSSAYSTAKDISLTGRAGHHGLSVAYDGHILEEDLEFTTNDGRDWIHAATVNHLCPGCVISRLKGPAIKALDLHSNTPFETLYVEVLGPWSYLSSGDPGAWPHTGARTTYWNLDGKAGTPENSRNSQQKWGHIQTNLIGDLSIPNILTPDREWYENVTDLEPANLYEAQLVRRQSLPNDEVFSDGDWGIRSNWFERDPSRWRVNAKGLSTYELYFSGYGPLTGNGLGEYAVTDLGQGTRISGKCRTRENLTTNPSADVAVLLGFRDNRNYLCAIVRADSGTEICRVRGGARTTLAMDETMKLDDNEWHDFQFVRRDDEITFYWDDARLTATEKLFKTGRVGIGSEDDSVEFQALSDFLIVPDGDFASWIAAFDLSENDAVSEADPDGDGLSNLFEFAYGLDPVTRDTTGMPALIRADGESRFTFNGVRSRVTYQVQLSNDLVTWRAFEATAQGTLDHPITRVIPDSEMLEPGRLFVRLNVAE